MTSKVESLIYDFLNRETHGLISNPSTEKMPLVGKPRRLITSIVSLQKGFFIIEAHTGAGKTMFSKIIYHLARFGELPSPYNVVYINTQELSNMIGISDVQILDQIEDLMFRPKAYIKNHSGLERIIFSYPFEDHLEKNEGFSDALMALSKNNKRLLVIIDELDKVLAIPIAWERVANWARAIRKHYNLTQNIPLKIIITLPKVRQFRETIENNLRVDPATWVFSEFFEYVITPDIIKNYIEEVNMRFRDLGLNKNFIGDILDRYSANEAPQILAPFKSGRYIFERLINYLAKSIALWLVKCHGHSTLDVVSKIEDIIKLANNCNKEPLSLKITDENLGLIDPLARGIIEGRYYSGRPSKREVIRIWADGMKKLARLISDEEVSIVSSEMNYIIYQVRNDAFLWLSFNKQVKPIHFQRALRKINNKIRDWIEEAPIPRRRDREKPQIKIILLVPERSYATLPSEPLIKRWARELSFNPVFFKAELTVEELMAMVSSEVGMTRDVAEPIMNELQQNIRANL